ncbi:formate/nitrite transporter [Limimonas halophila]|uniref:Formate/nitrite transporter n=1 Tax=Limimonas halophila TaxID=1082479 RepID=A0A1G7L8Z1_9PROT|nr:formate/nitrite transporter family protein [Limimonas halophila]SDF45841.1 formate/nitrite transporter [Limimonas halophila]
MTTNRNHTPKDQPPPSVGVDALLPEQMAEKAEDVGAKKTRLRLHKLLALSVLAGAFVAIGVLFALNVSEGGAAGPLVPGLAFSTAVILVAVGGAELFTSNNLMVMALVSGHIRLRELLHAWGVVYVGNIVGAVATVVMAVLAGQAARLDGGLVEEAAAVSARMADTGAIEAFFRGVLGNVLVCMAVWLSYSARTTTDRILSVIPPVTAYYVMGLEHAVAVMVYMPLAAVSLILHPSAATKLAWPDGLPPLTALGDFVAHLVPVTIGNVFGGGVLVGAVYWFIFLEGRRE